MRASTQVIILCYAKFKYLVLHQEALARVQRVLLANMRIRLDLGRHVLSVPKVRHSPRWVVLHVLNVREESMPATPGLSIALCVPLEKTQQSEVKHVRIAGLEDMRLVWAQLPAPRALRANITAQKV
jgi:hypothetical protein